MNKKSISVVIAALMFAVTMFAATPASAVAPSGVVASQIQTVTPSIAAVPIIWASTCGWGLCIMFNLRDQQALRAGGSVALGAAICRLSIPCWVAGSVLATANGYLIHHGWCGRGLGVRISGGNAIFCYR